MHSHEGCTWAASWYHGDLPSLFGVLVEWLGIHSCICVCVHVYALKCMRVCVYMCLHLCVCLVYKRQHVWVICDVPLM